LHAQNRSPLADRITVSAAFGGLSGAANLNDAGTADWRLGWAGSLDASYWILPRVALRVGGTWAQDSLRSGAIAGRGKFNKFAYDADIVLRYPLTAGASTVTPYILGGAGAISVHQLASDSTWTKFAGNFGGGIEYRFGRLGVRAKAVTMSTSSTGTASTRPSTTSPGRAASRFRSERQLRGRVETKAAARSGCLVACRLQRTSSRSG